MNEFFGQSHREFEPDPISQSEKESLTSIEKMSHDQLVEHVRKANGILEYLAANHSANPFVFDKLTTEDSDGSLKHEITKLAETAAHTAELFPSIYSQSVVEDELSEIYDRQGEDMHDALKKIQHSGDWGKFDTDDDES